MQPKTLSKDIFKLLADNMMDMVALHEPDGTYVYISPSVEKILGYTPEELLGTNPYELFHSEDIPHIKNESHRQAVKGYEVVSVEYRIRKKDGDYIWFDTNTVPLMNAKGEVEKLQTVSRNITDKKASENALLKLNKELGELNNQKDKILSVISHDLRGPFLSFQGLFNLILKDFDNCTKEELYKVLKNLKKNTDNNFNLLQDLLLWSKSQFGAFTISEKLLNLNRTAEKVISALKPQADEKSITIQNKIPEGLSIKTDEEMLKTILRNLISNALKFSEKETAVVIKARSLDKFLEISVIDKGRGIAPELIERILSIKTVHTTEGTEGEQGFGLGLSICKDFITKMGGHIYLESEIGKGSKFSFTIPTQ